MNEFACVYIAFSKKDEVLYVGESIRLPGRLKAHHKESKWFASCKRFEVVVCESKDEALALEKRLILELEPKYNVTHGKNGSRHACLWAKKIIRNELLKNHLSFFYQENEIKLYESGVNVLQKKAGRLQARSDIWKDFRLPFNWYFYQNWPKQFKAEGDKT